MMNKKSLDEIRSSITSPLKQATLCFLVKNDQVLLAMKKRGFAEGKWNGVGGKVDKKDNNIRDAMIRETQEEIEVTPIKLDRVALLSFYHQKNKDADQQVTVYMCDKWAGKPQETEEMAPKWFRLNEIPYDDMWEDDQHWLPRILSGEKLKADFLFDDEQNLLEHTIKGLNE